MISQNKTQFSEKKLMIQGHRGGFKPDNTIRAFTMALEHNVEAIELDVSISIS